jgi:hypothetical protein
MKATPLPAERTTQHAADLTDVLRSFLKARLDLDKRFFRTIGSRRRSHLAKLMSYKYAITQR